MLKEVSQIYCDIFSSSYLQNVHNLDTYSRYIIHHTIPALLLKKTFFTLTRVARVLEWNQYMGFFLTLIWWKEYPPPPPSWFFLNNSKTLKLKPWHFAAFSNILLETNLLSQTSPSLPILGNP